MESQRITSPKASRTIEVTKKKQDDTTPSITELLQQSKDITFLPMHSNIIIQKFKGATNEQKAIRELFSNAFSNAVATVDFKKNLDKKMSENAQGIQVISDMRQFVAKEQADLKVKNAVEQLIKKLEQLPTKLVIAKDADKTTSTQSKIADPFEAIALQEYFGVYKSETIPDKVIRPVGNNLADFQEEKASSSDEEHYFDPLATPLNACTYNSWKKSYEKHADGKGLGAVCILDITFTSKEDIEEICTEFAKMRDSIRAVLFSAPLGKLIQEFRDKNVDSLIKQLSNTYVVCSIIDEDRKPFINKLYLYLNDFRSIYEWVINTLKDEGSQESGGMGFDSLFG